MHTISSTFSVMATVRPLPDLLAKKAIAELNEVPDRIPFDLATIKQWLAKSPHIRARTDDQFLMIFLRGCKYSLEKVKEKLDSYYTIRTALPSMMAKRDPLEKKSQAIIKLGLQCMLPETVTPDGPRIFLHRAGIYSTDLYSAEDTMRVGMMINDMRMITDDQLIVSGAIAVIDISGMTMNHMLQMTPSLLKQITMLTQEGSPLRSKATHYINIPPSFEVGFNVFKKLLNEKNRSRIHLHSSLESLYEYIPQRMLPTEYGGQAGSISDLSNDLNQKLIAMREYFLEDSKYGVDESKRPGKPKTAATLFGVEGSFRSLNVD